MDFSYFNAVLKSATFPPYDPWYAAGTMNYYYWGYVFVGVLVKWLGIVPSFAYNLIIPTLFSMVTMGAFCIGYNLSHPRSQNGVKGEDEVDSEDEQSPPAFSWRPILIGLTAALGMAVVGNLGTLRMFLVGWEQLGVPGGVTATTGFFTRLAGLPVGIWNNLAHGAQMPYSLGDWYWLPSRAIPAPGDVEPITEFPIFTFLYADLHAHMIAMAIAMLALAWAVAVLLGKAHWKSIGAGVLSIVFGGLAIGAMYPTNLSDIYAYLPIGMVVLGYALFRYGDIGRFTWLPRITPTVKRLFIAGGGLLLLAVVSYGLYLPYRLWYAQPYSSVIPWTGTHTPLWSYFTHWGLFLFLIVSWMVWETHEWMANTPLVSLRKLEKYSSLIVLGVVLLLLACLLLSLKIPGADTTSLLSKLPIGRGASLAWFILPLAAWAGILILRPGQPDVKRLVLFFIGTALTLTLAVELIVLKGDIGRMNTVFKFYLQAWTLFSLSAAAALIWLLPAVIKEWSGTWRTAWQVGLVMLVGGAAMFTVLAGADKIRDRMNPLAPHTLDGMAYMQTSTYSDNGKDMALDEDYVAIQWMQNNVKGSPVIVETNTVEYRWGTRFTIYTGLPGVVGWNWHQRQQRGGVVPTTWVTDRVDEIGAFYNTDDRQLTEDFIHKYNVSYIIVGQLEEAYYSGVGLAKFMAWNGDLWTEVYHQGQTTIYKVLK